MRASLNLCATCTAQHTNEMVSVLSIIFLSGRDRGFFWHELRHGFQPLARDRFLAHNPCHLGYGTIYLGARAPQNGV